MLWCKQCFTQQSHNNLEATYIAARLREVRRLEARRLEARRREVRRLEAARRLEARRLEVRRACAPEASSPELTCTGRSELVRERARTRTISGAYARGILTQAHVHGRVKARAQTSTDAYNLGRVCPRRPCPSSRAWASPSSCANKSGCVRARMRAILDVFELSSRSCPRSGANERDRV